MTIVQHSGRLSAAQKQLPINHCKCARTTRAEELPMAVSGMHYNWGWATSSSWSIRSDPNGPDQDVNFSWNSNFGYPPSVYDPNMTSVTAELDVGQDQEGVMTLKVWFFS